MVDQLSTTLAGMYLETEAHSVRATSVLAYLEIQQVKLSTTFVGAYLEIEQVSPTGVGGEAEQKLILFL